MRLSSLFNKTQFAAMVLFFTFASAELALAAQEANAIQVENPFAREVPPTAPASASFMTLKNMSNHDIVLTQAHSNVANKVELHTHTNENGVMKMRQIPSINIPAEGETALQPGGLHIMLIDLKQPLKSGETIQVELTFKDGSHKTVSMPVKSIKGMNMMHHDHNHEHHH